MLEMLSEQGWHLVRREVGQIWYRDEVWTIESVWRPVGERAYLSFIVDPQAPTDRTQGEDVWAVAISLERPYQHPVGAVQVPIRPGWERVHRAEFLEAIKKLRGPHTVATQSISTSNGPCQPDTNTKLRAGGSDEK
jgi:hypothetical protein